METVFVRSQTQGHENGGLKDTDPEAEILNLMLQRNNPPAKAKQDSQLNNANLAEIALVRGINKLVAAEQREKLRPRL